MAGVTIAQTSMLAITIALLVYIAVLLTGMATLSTPDELSQDVQKRDIMATSVDYNHKTDISRAASTILLSGITLEPGDVLLLMDNTPFATRGHLAIMQPCAEHDPSDTLVEVLVGAAPELAPMGLSYLHQASNPENDMCLFHGQFGFGTPITDIALKNTSSEPVTFSGKHSVVITIHESYRPATPFFKEIEHKKSGE